MGTETRRLLAHHRLRRRCSRAPRPAELGCHKVLHVGHEFGQLDQAVRVRVAVAQRIEERPRERAVTLASLSNDNPWLRAGSRRFRRSLRFLISPLSRTISPRPEVCSRAEKPLLL